MLEVSLIKALYTVGCVKPHTARAACENLETVRLQNLWIKGEFAQICYEKLLHLPIVKIITTPSLRNS